jgi:hypothetical protein
MSYGSRSTVAALALVGAIGCGKSAGPVAETDSGHLKVTVLRPKGPAPTLVTYTVVNSSNQVILGPGALLVQPNALFSVDLTLPGTPPGDAGDVVQLSADGSCTGVSAPFPITAGATTGITVTINCPGSASKATGTVGITASFEECPKITAAVVAPAETSFNGSASLSATASDADPGDTLTFSWTPASNVTNVVSTATSSSATYTCGFPGLQQVQVAVSNGHTPPCSATATLNISCGSPPCGDGIIQPGETCDPPIPGICSPTCHLYVNPACTGCEQIGTNEGICAFTSARGQGSVAGAFGCDSLASATDKSNCLALLDCLRSTACRDAIHSATPDYGESSTYPQSYDDPHPCLCGAISLTACVGMTSGWTGVCAPQFTAAAAADGQTLAIAYTAPASPVSVAVNLSVCDIDALCEGGCGIAP